MSKWIWRALFGTVIGLLGVVIDNLLLGHDTSPFLWGVIGMLFVNLVIVAAEFENRRY
jgi:hypothetical protein